MEKTEIKVNYSGSGVKTLAVFSYLFYILGALLLAFSVVGYLVSNDADADAIAKLSGIALTGLFPVSAFLIACGAIFSGLSSIARTALYKRTLLEQEYRFS